MIYLVRDLIHEPKSVITWGAFVYLAPAQRGKKSVMFTDMENPNFYSSMKVLSFNQRIRMMKQVLRIFQALGLAAPTPT